MLAAWWFAIQTAQDSTGKVGICRPLPSFSDVCWHQSLQQDPSFQFGSSERKLQDSGPFMTGLSMPSVGEPGRGLCDSGRCARRTETSCHLPCAHQRYQEVCSETGFQMRRGCSALPSSCNMSRMTCFAIQVVWHPQDLFSPWPPEHHPPGKIPCQTFPKSLDAQPATTSDRRHQRRVGGTSAPKTQDLLEATRIKTIPP